MTTVLIVEDNEKNMKLLRDVLGFKGYTVLEAVDGETGVALATERLPELVLMDIQLPGINGVEAGFDGFVSKPVNLKEFMAAVQKALAERSA